MISDDKVVCLSVMISSSPQRRPFEPLPKHELSANPFDDPFGERPTRSERPRVDVATEFLRARMAGRRWSFNGTWNRAVDYLNANRIQIFLITVAALAIVLMLSAVLYWLIPHAEPIAPLDPRGLAGVEAQTEPIVTAAPVLNVIATLAAQPTVALTGTPEPTIKPGANLPACLTYSDAIEIQKAMQGEANGLHNDVALYFLAGQMLMDKQRTNCEPLYRWSGRDNAQARLPLTQAVMNAWVKAAADYPEYFFGYCAQVGSDSDYNMTWLPQRIAGKLPLLKLSFAFGSADGSSSELAFNCADLKMK